MHQAPTFRLSFLKSLLSFTTSLLLFLLFFVCLSRLSDGQHQAGRESLEQALRRSAVACYAAEGIYPPSVAYLEEHYGLQIDKRRFVVHYTAIAENLMPDITVLEK